MFRLLFLCGLAATFISCGKMEARLAYSTQSSCGFILNSFGSRVSWKHASPVKVSISSSWPDYHIQAVHRAAKAWNDSTGRMLLNIEKKRVGTDIGRDGVNGLYWMTKWPSGRKTEQAQTILFFSNGGPSEGDIKVDAHYFNYYDDDSSDRGQYHLESLLIHEFGHLLGLEHSYTPRTVMSPFLYPFDRRVEITPEDLGAIECEYPK